MFVGEPQAFRGVTMKFLYSVERGYTYWGEPIGMKFKVWRSLMRITGDSKVMMWRSLNFRWRGVLVRLEMITERKV